MKNIFLILFTLIIASCNGQVFKYRSIPESLRAKVSGSNLNTQAAAALSKPNSKGCNLEEILDKTRLDDSQYVTTTLNEIFASCSEVLLPNSAMIVSEEGLDIPSDFILIFQPNSLIRIEDNGREQYEVLRIHNVANVTIIRPTIVGDRTGHKGKAGEWGMGISVRSSHNIVIQGAHISNCWGDGIYVGQDAKRGSSANVKIVNSILDNNRRNGISITSVDGLDINNVIVANTNGTLPMSGIDIEPSNANEVAKNIQLSNIFTYNNVKGGIIVNLNKLSNRGEKKPIVSINIDSHEDEYSGMGFYVSGVKDHLNAQKIEGSIVVSNSVLKNNGTPINFGNNLEFLPSVTISKIDVIKKNSTNLERVKERTRTYRNIVFKD